MHILAANVTNWSPKARWYLNQRRWDVALLAEVHLHPKLLKTSLQTEIRAGRTPSFSKPLISADNSAFTWGGAMVLRSNHTQGGPLQRDAPFPRSPYVNTELLQTARKHQAWESSIPQLAAQ